MPLRFQPARGASVLISASSRGPTGAAATVDAGTATALAAGATPTVANSGTTAAATFDFGIPRGADAGIKWLYETSTSMAEPTSGYMRFNNGTLASVTAIALSATGSGSDVSTYVATWDDSTATKKGYAIIREEAGAVAAVFEISAVTDNGAWLELTVAHVSGSLSLTAADPLYITHYRTGDDGADGEVAVNGTPTTGNLASFSGAAEIEDAGVAVIDEDNMASDSAAHVPTQQSVKAYADTKQPIDAALTSLAGLADTAYIDDDTFATAAANNLASAESIKAYADTKLALAGGTLSGTVNAADNVIQRPEIKDYGETVNAIGSIGGGSQDIDLTLGNVVTGTVDTSETTFTFSNPSATSKACSFTLILTNGGSQTVNWPAAVDWAGATAPSLTAAGVDILTFVTVDAGTIWYGFAAGLDMS